MLCGWILCLKRCVQSICDETKGSEPFRGSTPTKKPSFEEVKLARAGTDGLLIFGALSPGALLQETMVSGIRGTLLRSFSEGNRISCGSILGVPYCRKLPKSPSTAQDALGSSSF